MATAGADVGQRTPSGVEPLFFAIGKGDLAVAEWLVGTGGAELRAVDSNVLFSHPHTLIQVRAPSASLLSSVPSSEICPSVLPIHSACEQPLSLKHVYLKPFSEQY